MGVMSFRRIAAPSAGMVKTIAHALTERLPLNLPVDGSARERVQAEARQMPKRIPRKRKCLPDQQETSVELALKRARARG
jgi:hypothetical protein